MFGHTVIDPVATCLHGTETLQLVVNSDNGRSWVPSPGLDIGPDCLDSLADVSLPSPQTAWTIRVEHGHALAYRSTDQGRRWTRLAQPALSKQALHYRPVIQAADAEHAWLIVAGPSANGQSVYATADGGRTWNRLALP